MRSKSCLCAFILAALPIAATASNPHIIINGDPPNPTILVGENFTFGANNLGGGDFSFQNESGVNWQSLVVTATLPDLTAITCGPGPFVTCTVAATAVGSNYLYNIIFGPTVTPGITNGEIFSIDLNDSGTDPNGSGSWGAGTDFSAKANAVPEPSSIAFALLGVSLAGVIYYRRRFLNDQILS